MALPVLPALIGALGSWFFRKTTTTDDAGSTTECRKARPVPVALTLVIAFFVLWYFLIHPILSYHFPEYGFPSIGAEILAAIAAIG